MTKRKRDEAEKSHRLSLAELAGHDDVCSDALVDNAYYKSRIRKNRTKHIPIRGIKEDEVPRILLQKVIVEKDLAGAEKALLALPGLRRYKKSLRSKTEQEHFLIHLRKYISMYSTDCAWEVSTTNRYTITTYEAAVTARRRIKQGDTIKYLVGTLVPLTSEESAELDLSNRNFSIVVSARKKNSSIFLGPARFANHDCDANGRLVTRGSDGMEVVAMKNIEVGNEITVSYGDDYFGPKNMDCLCHTCEVLERNGWTSKAAVIDPASTNTTPAPEASTTPQSRGLKRKREVKPFSSSSQLSHKKANITQSPSKLQLSWTPPGTSDSEMADLAVASAQAESPDGSIPPDELALSPPSSSGGSKKRRLSDAVTPSSSDPMPQVAADSTRSKERSPQSGKGRRESKMTKRLLGQIGGQEPFSPAPTSPSSNDSISEGAPSNNDMPRNDLNKSVTIKIESVETTKVETDADTITVASLRQASDPKSDMTVETGVPQAERPKSPEPMLPSVPHVVSTLSTTTVTKEILQNERAQLPSGEAVILPSIESVTASAVVSKLTVHPVVGTIRIAGDYILTRKLLAQPHDRWVQCHNEKCLGFFIQPNGYQTRRECPRCERHSMLYGFPWPKTDPDPRKLLERSQAKKKNANAEFSAYRRQGRSGKGTWVEGGGDEEERVMDHRTIHRFVLPDEEREITRNGLLKDAEVAREAGDVALAMLEARLRAGSRGHGTESAARDTSESLHGSATPDEGRRRSNRFVTKPVGVYMDR